MRVIVTAQRWDGPEFVVGYHKCDSAEEDRGVEAMVTTLESWVRLMARRAGSGGVSTLQVRVEVA